MDVARLLLKLKKEGAAGVILDLRHNGGGLLDEAVSLTGLFTKPGPVVQIRGSDGHTDIREDHDGPMASLYGGPLIVLNSRLSASASEIVAGALQDYGRALIVGEELTAKGRLKTWRSWSNISMSQSTMRLISAGPWIRCRCLGALSLHHQQVLSCQRFIHRVGRC